MALKITRAVDTRLYGGFDLDPTDLEGTFDHRVWVRKVIDGFDNEQRVVVNIEDSDGITEKVILVGETHSLNDKVVLTLSGVQSHVADQPTYCHYCMRGDLVSKREIPQARFGIEAPRDYLILRHDARKR